MKDAYDHITTNYHIECIEEQNRLSQLESTDPDRDSDDSDNDCDGNSTRVPND